MQQRYGGWGAIQAPAVDIQSTGSFLLPVGEMFYIPASGQTGLKYMHFLLGKCTPFNGSYLMPDNITI